MSTENGIFLDRYVIGQYRTTVSFRTNDTCYRYMRCFISVYFNVKYELEAAAWHFPHWMMWPSFARRVCDIHAHMQCVCVCVLECGVCLRASVAARVKRSKVWAHVTKLSDTSVRCNICSSVIVNKGGNTSNIMKHLLTKHIYLKQCAVFTMSPGSTRETHSHQMLIQR